MEKQATKKFKAQMKAYKSLKNGRFMELGRHGIVWYPVVDPASVTEGKMMPTLVPLSHKMERKNLDEHDLGQIEEIVFTFEFEDKKKTSLPCKKCGGDLKQLKTKNGDPEGIRNDMQCKKCKVIYGCSRTRVFEIKD